MRIACEPLGHLIMAGGTDFSSYIVPRRCNLGLSSRGLGFRGRRSQRSGAHYAGAQDQHQKRSQSRAILWNRTYRKLRYRPISMHENYRLGCPECSILSELNQQSRIKYEHYGPATPTKVTRILNPITSEAALRAEHHFMAESYFLFAFRSVMFITSADQAVTQSIEPIEL
jgi:hypothetical protein